MIRSELGPGSANDNARSTRVCGVFPDSLSLDVLLELLAFIGIGSQAVRLQNCVVQEKTFTTESIAFLEKGTSLNSYY